MNFVPSLHLALPHATALPAIATATVLTIMLLTPILVVPFVGRWGQAHNAARGALFAATVLALLSITLLGDGSIAARVAWGGLRFENALSLGLQIDRPRLAMLALTGFLGGIIVGFSNTYLRNEVEGPSFVRRMASAVFLVQLFVLSTSLLGHAFLWLGISCSVHRLLRHYDERPRARLAARKKFLVSRVGDLCLYVALVLLYREFGTLDLAELAAANMTNAPASASTDLAVVLTVCTALLKSAQFPFHSWLPETMDAPTPVSAFMHAGVVNSGAFLLIELAPLLARSQCALLVLIAVGGTSAALGTVVGALQNNRKTTLAWSTVAQMGFLFFELGLGFPGAALLHLIAHGVYKAHAFLRSGTFELAVLRRGTSLPRSFFALGSCLSLWGLVLLVGCPWLEQRWHQVLPLGTVWAVACSQYLMGPEHLPLAHRGRALLFLGGSVWAAAWFAEGQLGGWLFALPSPTGIAAQAVIWSMVLLLVTALLLSSLKRWNGAFFEALYVHLLSGLYLGELTDRVTRALWPDRLPTPSRSLASAPGELLTTPH